MMTSSSRKTTEAEERHLGDGVRDGEAESARLPTSVRRHCEFASADFAVFDENHVGLLLGSVQNATPRDPARDRPRVDVQAQFRSHLDEVLHHRDVLRGAEQLNDRDHDNTLLRATKVNSLTSGGMLVRYTIRRLRLLLRLVMDGFSTEVFASLTLRAPP